MLGFGARFRVAGYLPQVMSELLPITTIAGYLGAGKTTLVNHLLRNANGLRLAVLVNEFGELPIDEDLIEAEDDDIISIAGGCICCSYGNDLTLALIEMAAMDPRPDHVIIEASGVAVPSAITASVGLLEGYRSDGIVILADAETVEGHARARYVGDTVLRQIKDANIILLNKTDLVEPAQVEKVLGWLEGENSAARILPVERSVVEPATVLESFLDQSSTPGPHHLAQAFDMHLLRFGEVSDAEALAREIATGGFGIVRAKGFVATPDCSVLIQIVGNRFEVTPNSKIQPEGVVCLGLKEDLSKAGLDALMQKY